MTDPTHSGGVADAVTILQLSDTHLAGDGSRHYGIVDTHAALTRVLRRAETLRRIDVVVMSGDLSDDGSEESYRLLQRTVEPWAGDRGAPVLYVMGNHDGRDGFESVLGARTGAALVGGLRFLRLDTSVPGFGYGSVDAEQLAWLRSELRSPAAHGSVLVLHHPPVAARTPLLRALELQRPDALLDAIAGTDVRLILAGHFHHALVTTVRGIPLVVAPGITNTTDVLAAPTHERAVIGSGAALVTVPLTDQPPSVTYLTAPSDSDGTEVFDLGPDRVAAIAGASGVLR